MSTRPTTFPSAPHLTPSGLCALYARPFGTALRALTAGFPPGQIGLGSDELIGLCDETDVPAKQDQAQAHPRFSCADEDPGRAYSTPVPPS